MSHNRSIRNINCLHQKKQKEILTNDKDDSLMLKMYTDLGRCVSNFVFLLWPVSMLLLLYQKNLIIFVRCVYIWNDCTGQAELETLEMQKDVCPKMMLFASILWDFADTKVYSFIIWKILQYGDEIEQKEQIDRKKQCENTISYKISAVLHAFTQNFQQILKMSYV